MVLRRIFLFVFIYIIIFYAFTAKAAGYDGRLIEGSARVVDGDTLVIGDTRVRLFGIDAPEMGQECVVNGRAWQCGKASREKLVELIGGSSVACHDQGVDRYGRVIGLCVTKAHDLNGMMVLSGYAVNYDRYTRDYIGMEHRAKTDKRGIWKGDFQRPEEYRHN